MSALLMTPTRWVRAGAFLALLAVAGGFGYFHSVVGGEISFLFFYLLPVAGATWFAGRTAGVIMAGVCGIMALGADIAVGREYSQAWIPVYNALVVCGFFIISAYALSWLRITLQHEARLAREDVLTSIPNLRAFQEEFPEQLKSAARRKIPITFGLVDLSDVGYINDRWGTSAGDLLLRVTAHTLQELQRPGDLLSRVAGTTFAVIYPGVGQAEAQRFMEQIRERILDRMKGYDRPISIAIAAVTVDEPTEEGDRILDHASAVLRTLRHNGDAPHPFRVERGGGRAVAGS
jgi:diguanylate cyclase (GGDEF)-like protein